MEKDLLNPMLNQSHRRSQTTSSNSSHTDSDDSFYRVNRKNTVNNNNVRGPNRYREDDLADLVQRLPTSRGEFGKMRENLVEDFKEMIYEGKDNPETHYTEKYMKRLMGASDFFDAVAKDVPLNELLSIKRHCNFNEDQIYCPILVQIMDPKLQEHYQGNYLLEVWNKQGCMVYQRVLKKKLRAWHINLNNTFVFLLDRADEDSNLDFFRLLVFPDSLDLEQMDLGTQNHENSTAFDQLIEHKILDWTLLSNNQVEKGDKIFVSVTPDNFVVVGSNDEIHAAKLDTLRNLNVNREYYEDLAGQKEAVEKVYGGDSVNFPKGHLHLDANDNLHKLISTNVAKSMDCLVAIVEKEQNILEYNYIMCNVKDNDKSIQDEQEEEEEEKDANLVEIRLMQKYELVQREQVLPGVDRVKKVCHVTIKGGKFATVALRDSGQVDFYWEGALVFSSDSTSAQKLGKTWDQGEFTLYQNIFITFDQIILDQAGSTAKGEQTLVVPLNQEQRISLEGSYMCQQMDERARTFIRMQQLRDAYKPYETFVLFQNYLFVAHGNIISYYDIESKKWGDHIMFGSRQETTEVSKRQEKQSNDVTFASCSTLYQSRKKVVQVFRHASQRADQEHTIGVLFNDGQFELLQSKMDEFGTAEGWVHREYAVRIEGTIKQVSGDVEHYRSLFVLAHSNSSEQNSQVKLYVFTEDQLYDISENLQGALTKDSQIVPLFAPAENTQFVLMNPTEGVIRIYELQSTLEGQNEDLHLKVPRVMKIIDPNLASRVQKGNTIHTAVSSKIGDNLFLFDQTQQHVYTNLEVTSTDTRKATSVFSHSEIHIKGVHLIDNRYLYCLFDKEMDEEQKVDFLEQRLSEDQIVSFSSGNGLGIIDLEFFESQPDVWPQVIPVCSTLSSVNSKLIFSEEQQKFLFVQGYSRLKVMPIMHQNVLRFESMRSKDNYLLMSHHHDSLVAIDKRSRQYTWCMQTGKLKKRPQKVEIIPSGDFEVFRTSLGEGVSSREENMYSQGLFPYSLVYRKEPSSETSDDSFYNARVKDSAYGRSHNYLRNLNKSFHEFRVLRLNASGQPETAIYFQFPRLLEKEQHLFFNDKLNSMLELQGNQAYIWKAKPIFGTKLVKMENCFKLPYVPESLSQGDAFQLYSLFSPNFKRFLDIDIRSGAFVVRETRSGRVVYKIPKSFLSVPQFEDKIKTQAKFMAWESNIHVRMIDIDANPHIEELIEIPNEAWLRENGHDQSYPIEIASATVDFLNIKPFEGDQSSQAMGNFFKQGFPLKPTQVIERLMRKHNERKRIWYINPVRCNGKINENQIENSQILTQTTHTSFGEMIREKNGTRFTAIYDKLFTVDFCSDPKMVLLELPFTFYDWRIVEMLQRRMKNRSFDQEDYSTQRLKNMPISAARTLTLNILPNMNTVLHSVLNYDLATQIVNRANEEDLSASQMCASFYIPFIENIDGATPLHLALGMQKGTSEQVSQREDLRLADLFLSGLLKEAPLDHHGRSIANILPFCLTLALPSVSEYLDSRLLTTRQLRKRNRTAGKAMRQNYKTREESKFVTVCDLWPDERHIENAVFEEADLETETHIQIYDIPYIHDPLREEAHRFAMALKSCGTEVFRSEAVQNLIAFRWEITYKYVFWRQLIPYLVYFAVYLFYAVYIYSVTDNIVDAFKKGAGQAMLEFSTQTVLFLFSSFFLYTEIKQLVIKKPQLYFAEVWNYVDIVPPCLIILLILLDLFDKQDADDLDGSGLISPGGKYTMQAIANLFMWLKLFYFMRVFRSTGFFVNMFFRMVEESSTFFMIYLLINIAFFISFYIMSGHQVNIFWVYLLGLGEFDTEYAEMPAPFGMLIFFIGASLVIMVVMLNILIALISTAYESVTEEVQESNDFERLSLISEVAPFISREASEICKPNEFLIVAQNVSSLVNQSKEKQKTE